VTAVAALGLVIAGCAVPPPVPAATVKPAAVASPAANTAAAPSKPGSKQYAAAPAMQINTAKKYDAVIETSAGSLKAELYVGDAPATVNNFVFLAREGFYAGVPFHRIIKTFMIQTGDPTGTGAGGPGYRFADEKVTRRYDRGTLAMANAGPNTNGSQFFIMTQNNTTLPPNYTIFGKVTEGLDTLDKLADTPVGPDARGEVSKPATPPTIRSVSIAES
jgi:peptidylprolyl isomerase